MKKSRVKTSVEAAALALVKQLHAPAGMVNTLAVHSGASAFIKVWVDASLFPLEDLPKRFMGYRVESDKRPALTAFRMVSASR